MDKQALIDQLAARLRGALRTTRDASSEALDAARFNATEQEKKVDGRHALEFGALASGHARRERQLAEELEALARLRPKALGTRDPIALGALVEIEDEDTHEGRTFIVLPVGAGHELTVPDGDGVLSVVTPVSPIGRAVMGRRVGDVAEVTTNGEVREWTITWVA